MNRIVRRVKLVECVEHVKEYVEIYTIGHSNRTPSDFIRLLKKYGIEVLIDVRRFPSSRLKHFKAEELKQILNKEGIEYLWMGELGGFRRKGMKDSPNIAIKSEGFRNYADYMLSEDFANAVKKLIEVAKTRRVAMMCAERLFWRCHRMFLADYLFMRGCRVVHIINDSTRIHSLTKTARIVDGRLIYDKIGLSKD
jgi:uncharacterized protein (DUF488 family)